MSTKMEAHIIIEGDSATPDQIKDIRGDVTGVEDINAPDLLMLAMMELIAENNDELVEKMGRIHLEINQRKTKRAEGADSSLTGSEGVSEDSSEASYEAPSTKLH